MSTDHVNVRVFINHNQVSGHVLALDAVINVPLLGIEISKNALYPTELRIEIGKLDGN